MKNINSKKRFWIISFLSMVFLVLLLLWCVFRVSQLNQIVVSQREQIRFIENQHLDNSISFVIKSDVQTMVDKATRETLNTYISSQNSFLVLVGILITLIVTIVGIAAPIVANKDLKEGLQEKIEQLSKKEKERIIKKLNIKWKRMNNEMVSIRKETKQIQDDFNKITKKLFTDMINYQNAYKKIKENDLANEIYSETWKQLIEEKLTPDELISKLESLMASNDFYPAQWFFELGLLYFQKEEFGRARDCFIEAIKKKPDYTESYHELAKTQFKIAKPIESWANIEKALALHPGPPNIDMLKTRCAIFKELGLNTNAINESVEIKLENKFHNTISFKMIKVSKGVFCMGATKEQKEDAVIDEYPVHKVMLKDYYIGETVVTQSLWKAIMENNPSHFRHNGNNKPVEMVSLDDIKEFLANLNEKTGRLFRLPTEAEWEYAARGGNQSKGTKYSGSDSLQDVAWYDCDETRPVKQKKSNEIGLYDMSGNVKEWCLDRYDLYSEFPQYCPENEEGIYSICRGGSYKNDATKCRVSYRSKNAPGNRNRDLGFRLALDVNT